MHTILDLNNEPDTEASKALYTVHLDSVSQTEWAESLDRFQDATLYQTYPYANAHIGEPKAQVAL
jgi:hypothetical protein